jgi:DNA-binding HxlR family transcriptional regulator
MYERVSELFVPKPSDRTPEAVALRVEQALKLLEGRWKLLILFGLFGGRPLRFSELMRAIHGISEKTLAKQLRQLEAAGLVHRMNPQVVPPRVEYGLTEWGQALRPALDALLRWVAGRDQTTSFGAAR